MFKFIVLAGLLLALALVCGSVHAARPYDTPGPPGTTLPHPAHMDDYHEFWNVVQYETDAVLGQPAGRVELRELRLVDD